MKINLSAYESRVLWFLFRKTYGWGKKTDWISLSQFSQCIGIDRRLVHRAIKGLSSKKMIVIERDDSGNLRYGFQKDYDKWVLSSKKMTVINRDDRVSSKKMTRLSSKEIPTKTTITKTTITKTIMPDGLSEKTFLEFLAIRNKKRAPLPKESYPRFFKHLQKICDETRASPEEILNQSIINGWQGIFPLKNGGNGNGGNRFGGSKQSAAAKTGRAQSDGEPYPIDHEFS